MSSVIAEKQKKKAALKKALRDAAFARKAELKVTSLMDIFVNVLIYLLMNYSTSPVDIAQSKERTLPKSTTAENIQAFTTVGITKGSILVNRKKVCAVQNNTVDPSLKRDKQASQYIIEPLFQRLKDEVDRMKKIEQYNPKQKFKPIILVVADKDMSFRLLSEVMYTAGQVAFSKFKFAVVRKNG